MLGSLGTESWATAQLAPNDAERRADLAFEDGKELLRTGDWRAACAKFEESFALDPSASTKVKLARCHEREEHLVEAVAAYRHAEELNRTLSRDPARAREIAQLIAAELRRLEPTVPKLSVRLSPPETKLEQVSVDGRPLASGTPRALPLDPGRHVLVLRAVGYRAAALELELARGEHRDVEVVMVPLASTNASAAGLPASQPVQRTEAARSSERAPRSDGTTRRWVGGALAGSGVAALFVAGYFGLRTLSLVDDAGPYCDDARGDCYEEGLAHLESARRAQTTGIIVASVGGVLTSAGVVVYLTAPRHSGDERAQSSLSLVLGGRSAALRGDF